MADRTYETCNLIGTDYCILEFSKIVQEGRFEKVVRQLDGNTIFEREFKYIGTQHFEKNNIDLYNCDFGHTLSLGEIKRFNEGR